MLHFKLPSICSNQVYPSSIIINAKRNDESIQAISAHRELYTPNFNVGFDYDYDTYVIEFKGAWKRIRLDSNYFCSFERSDIRTKKDDDISLNDVRTYVFSRLEPIVNLITTILEDIIPNGERVFAALSFWEFVNEAIEFNRIFHEGFRACFQLMRGDDELSPLFSFGGSFSGRSRIYSYDVIRIPSQTNIYYTHLQGLLNIESFRVASLLEKKVVIWFENKTLSDFDLKNLVSSLGYESKMLAGYHISQSLHRPHIFEFRDLEGMDFAYVFNCYRNWRMLDDVQNGTKRTIKRLSYALGGVIRTKLQLISFLFGSATTPLRFSSRTFDDFKYMCKILNDMFDNHPSKLIITSIIDRLPLFFSSSFGSFWRKITSNVNSTSMMTEIKWLDVSMILNGLHKGDDIAKRLRIAALPDTKEVINEVNLINPIESFTDAKYFEWNVYNQVLYLTNYYDMTSDVVKYVPDESDLSMYRLSWSKFRDLTKRIVYKGRTLTWNDYLELLISVDVKLHVMTGVIEYLKSFVDTIKIPDWNGSTPKLISIIATLERLELIKIDPLIPYKIVFVGVISEPVQNILKSMPKTFDVMTGIGAQAVLPNLRTSIESSFLIGTPYIIISDIDQSEGKDIDEVCVIVERQIKSLIKTATILVYKIMYTTPEVVNTIIKVVNELKVSRVYMIDSMTSGPFGIETYFLFYRSESSLQTMSSSVVLSWMKQREFYFKENTFDDDLFKYKVMRSKKDVIEALKDKKSFNFCFSSNQSNYNDIISVAGVLSDNYNVVPIGNAKNFEVLVYGSVSRRRSQLMRRIMSIPKMSISQGGSEFPLSGPRNVVRLPIFRYQGTTMTESRMYNLACKLLISKFIESEVEKGNILIPNIIDIGGRSAELASVIDDSWGYTVEDTHLLPECLSSYNVTHLNRYSDWKTVENYDDYNVIIATFVIMSEPSTADIQFNRIKFLHQLSERGKLVIFNYYSSSSIERIYYNNHRDITINDQKTKGSFANYDPLPELLLLNNDQLNEMTQLEVTIKCLINVMMYYGTAVSSELVRFIDDFNEFCPLVTFRT